MTDHTVNRESPSKSQFLVLAVLVGGCAMARADVPQASEPRKTSDFHGIDIRGTIGVEARVGALSVEVRGDAGRLKDVSTTVEDGVLVINTPRSMKNVKHLHVFVSAPRSTRSRRGEPARDPHARSRCRGHRGDQRQRQAADQEARQRHDLAERTLEPTRDTQRERALVGFEQSGAHLDTGGEIDRSSARALLASTSTRHAAGTAST